MRYCGIKDCTSDNSLSSALSGHHGKANFNDRIEKREMRKCGASFQEMRPNLKDSRRNQNGT